MHLSPHVIMATACVFAHRFYCRESFGAFDYRLVALAALFLAGKVEEHPKRLESILKGVTSLKLEVTDNSFHPEREEILDLEMVMLQVLCFDLVIDHPYRHVLKWAYMQRREHGTAQMGIQHDHEDEFAQRSWSFVNTTLRTTLCIQFPPKAIALTCLRMTAEQMKLDMPFDHLASEPALAAMAQECEQELRRQLAMSKDFT